MDHCQSVHANINDCDIAVRCAAEYLPPGPDPGPDPGLAPPAASPPPCRSSTAAPDPVREIPTQHHTLHSDFTAAALSPLLSPARMLEELDRWRALCTRYSDTRQTLRNFASSELQLWPCNAVHQPTKATVADPAGD
ncbi:fungal specific transcription factor domain-containing protein [Colletotrichum tabaci]|uniref:Fungal specific transcription factor domain-containing protein n=1 Tax=Colletotrichum tabaci TaxID=1209068 RepID=A0AAV9SSH5_9PEZI